MLFYSLFSKTGANLLLFSDICKRVSVFRQKKHPFKSGFWNFNLLLFIFLDLLLIESIYAKVYIV